MEKYKKVEEEIISLLKKKPEELKHAQDTLNFLLNINPESDFSLRMSALSHDIERVVYGKDEKYYSSYKEFKTAHSKSSSEITRLILLQYEIETVNIEKICTLILNHEFGPSLLTDADSLANFLWYDSMFGKVEISSLKETIERMYKRMSQENRKYIAKINFKNQELYLFLCSISS